MSHAAVMETLGEVCGHAYEIGRDTYGKPFGIYLPSFFSQGGGGGPIAGYPLPAMSDEVKKFLLTKDVETLRKKRKKAKKNNIPLDNPLEDPKFGHEMQIIGEIEKKKNWFLVDRHGISVGKKDNGPIRTENREWLSNGLAAVAEIETSAKSKDSTLPLYRALRSFARALDFYDDRMGLHLLKDPFVMGRRLKGRCFELKTESFSNHLFLILKLAQSLYVLNRALDKKDHEESWIQVQKDLTAGKVERFRNTRASFINNAVNCYLTLAMGNNKLKCNEGLTFEQAVMGVIKRIAGKSKEENWPWSREGDIFPSRAALPGVQNRDSTGARPVKDSPEELLATIFGKADLMQKAEEKGRYVEWLTTASALVILFDWISEKRQSNLRRRKWHEVFRDGTDKHIWRPKSARKMSYAIREVAILRSSQIMKTDPFEVHDLIARLDGPARASYDLFFVGNLENPESVVVQSDEKGDVLCHFPNLLLFIGSAMELLKEVRDILEKK